MESGGGEVKHRVKFGIVEEAEEVIWAEPKTPSIRWG